MNESNKGPQMKTGEQTIVHPCRIVGVLDNGSAGLTRQMRYHVSRAELIIGASRTLKLLADILPPKAEKRELDGHFMQVPQWIRSAQQRGRRVVVLATGDPLCHGIASFLQARLCIHAFEILPNLSMVQLACARLGMSWQTLKICSIHGRDTGEWQKERGIEHGLYPLLQAMQKHDRLAVFTSPANSPDRIARLMMSEGLEEDFNMAVLEHLMRDSERLIDDLSIKEAACRQFADPNMVLLWRTTQRPDPVLFGLADDDYAMRRPGKPSGGLITKKEVRAVSLARMQLRRSSIVWDIGAASGSVGLEAARLASQGYVYAIEKNRDNLPLALKNQRDMKISNYQLVHGKAPERLENWPDPDAVFIGGSGGNLAALIELALQRLKPGGHLVMNFITIENFNTAMNTLQALGANSDVIQMQVARSVPVLHMNRLAAENPVFIVSTQKTGEQSS